MTDSICLTDEFAAKLLKNSTERKALTVRIPQYAWFVVRKAKREKCITSMNDGLCKILRCGIQYPTNLRYKCKISAMYDSLAEQSNGVDHISHILAKSRPSPFCKSGVRPTTIRLPEWLHSAIGELADDLMVSINDIIIYSLSSVITKDDDFVNNLWRETAKKDVKLFENSLHETENWLKSLRFLVNEKNSDTMTL